MVSFRNTSPVRALHGPTSDSWCDQETVELTGKSTGEPGCASLLLRRFFARTEKFFDWWEHSRLKKFGIGLGRLFMWIDIVTDSIVAYDLYRTQRDRPYLWATALVFLILQYAVIWMVLFNPVRNLVRQGKFGNSVRCAAFSWPIFFFCYLVIGMPCIVCLDLLLVTNYLCDELEGKSFISKDFLVYYERMRVLCECLLEALPESIFQVSIWRAGVLSGDETSSSMGGMTASEALFVSVGVTMASLLKCLYLVYDGAVQRGVSPLTHARQIVNLGIGFTPYLSGVRKGKLLEVTYDKFTLTEGDVDKIMKATRSKKTKLKHLSMCHCDLTDGGAAKIAAGISEMKTVVSIDIRGNRSIKEAGERELGAALLELRSGTLQQLQCDPVFLDPGMHTTLKLVDDTVDKNVAVENTAICCCHTNGGFTLLAGLLKLNNSLTTLDLDADLLGDEGKKLIGRALTESRVGTVEWLTLRQVKGGWGVEEGHIDPEGCIDLDLSHRSLAPSDIACLAGVLRFNRSVTALDLTHNLLCGTEQPAVRDTSSAGTQSVKTIKHALKFLSSKPVQVGREDCGSSERSNLPQFSHKHMSRQHKSKSQKRIHSPSRSKNSVVPQREISKLVEDDKQDISGFRLLCESIGGSLPGQDKRPVRLMYLNLSYNSLGQQALECIKFLLKNNTSLTDVDLRGNKLTGSNKKALGDALSSNMKSNLSGFACNDWAIVANKRRSDLSKTKTRQTLQPEDAVLLAAVLTHNTTLTELSLADNNVAGTIYEGGRWVSSNTEGMHAIGTMLKRNKTLEVFDFTNNRIGPPGVKILVSALSPVPRGQLKVNSLEADDQIGSLNNRSRSALKKLVLAGNGIWGEGVSAIIDMLKKMVATTNCASEESVMESIKQTSLIELDLSNNSKIQEDQRELLNRWCVAAGVALKLKADKSRSDLQMGGGLGMMPESRPLPNIVSGERTADRGLDEDSRRNSSPSVRRSLYSAQGERRPGSASRRKSGGPSVNAFRTKQLLKAHSRGASSPKAGNLDM